MSEDLAPKKDIGFSKKNIIRQCEIALNQLCVESIDLLQLHYPVKDGDYAEILETLDPDDAKLVLAIRKGEIPYPGMSRHVAKKAFPDIAGNFR